MKKVLIINTIGLNYNGITSVIFNYSSYMNLSNIKLDFVSFNDMSLEIKNNFEKIGTVHILPHRKKNFIGYIKELQLLLRQNYDVIHIHGNSGTMAAEVLCAKMNKVSKILIHSHNSTCSHKILHKFLKTPMMRLATDYIACSDKAGKWLFGNTKYTVLNNAINIDAFLYNKKIRSQVRNEIGLNDEFLIGHIGHFTEQKNHTFLIDIFYEYQKLDPIAKLLLVSDGPKSNEIKQKVKALGLSDYVIFVGRRNDPQRLYQAMDFFVLPSLWEGLPVVALEAQASGLPVLLSDSITPEAKCTSCIFYLPLRSGAKVWAEKIYSLKNRNYKRPIDIKQEIRSHGFDINYEAQILESIYLNERN